MAFAPVLIDGEASAPPEPPPADGRAALLGESASFRRALELLQRFAALDINVLLLGETGTGKEVFARALHAASGRAGAPFVPVDCASLAENLIESEIFGHEKGAFTGALEGHVGRFERAQGGTLFLDEIGNLPVALQAKLLRVLQERRFERVGGRASLPFSARLVAATNVDLKEAMGAGRFRPDLYYRLHEACIALPPLRDRGDDVRLLAEHYARHYARRFGRASARLSDEALALLRRWRWPGNVRELENTMKAAVILADPDIASAQLPLDIRQGPQEPAAPAPAAGPASEAPLDDGWLSMKIDLRVHLGETDLKALRAAAADEAERALLLALGKHPERSGARLARMLNVDPKTLRGKLRKYGLGRREEP